MKALTFVPPVDSHPDCGRADMEWSGGFFGIVIDHARLYAEN
jgi:hypothetical protein